MPCVAPLTLFRLNEWESTGRVPSHRPLTPNTPTPPNPGRPGRLLSQILPNEKLPPHLRPTAESLTGRWAGLGGWVVGWGLSKGQSALFNHSRHHGWRRRRRWRRRGRAGRWHRAGISPFPPQRREVTAKPRYFCNIGISRQVGMVRRCR